MQTFNSWLEMLEETNYVDNAKYLDKYIYPNTGSVNVDFRVLTQTVSILCSFNTDSIDDYFYFLNFSKGMLVGAGVDYLDSIVPSINDYPVIDTDNFAVFGSLGAIVPGYSLIVPKKHFLSMSALDINKEDEYIELLLRMRKLYELIWHKKPIVFEHGTNISDQPKASSVVHSHTHIVNHHYSDEKRIIEMLDFQEVSSIEEILDYGQGKNYISYISPDDRYYIAIPMQEESQIMRKFIAKDVGLENEWDWRQYPHLDNSFETAKQLLLCIKKGMM